VIQPDDDANQAYYGKAVTPEDVILKRAVSQRGAAPLRAALAKAAGN
jgi:lipid-binding SYLF domain-containing protein